jgi:hypothetical protein
MKSKFDAILGRAREHDESVLEIVGGGGNNTTIVADDQTAAEVPFDDTVASTGSGGLITGNDVQEFLDNQALFLITYLTYFGTANPNPISRADNTTSAIQEFKTGGVTNWEFGMNPGSNNIKFLDKSDNTAFLLLDTDNDEVNFYRPLNVSANKIINLAAPTDNTDAATKEYVDNAIVAAEASDDYNLSLEQRSKYAVCGGGEWANYDDDGFTLADPGDFADGGFDIYIEYAPVNGTRSDALADQYSYNELFTIEDPDAWGGDLLECATVQSGDKFLQFLEFTSPDGTHVNGYGEDPIISTEGYTTSQWLFTRVRYTHDPTTGLTRVWRPALASETADGTEHGWDWVIVEESDKGGAYALALNDSNEPWKIGKGAGRTLISRVIVNDFSGTPMADFDPVSNTVDEYTVSDPVASANWVSTTAKIVNTSQIIEAQLGLGSSGTNGYEMQDYEKTATYVYVGYEESGGAWYIYRRTIATNARAYASGSSGYAAAWTNRAAETYT